MRKQRNKLKTFKRIMKVIVLVIILWLIFNLGITLQAHLQAFNSYQHNINQRLESLEQSHTQMRKVVIQQQVRIESLQRMDTDLVKAMKGILHSNEQLLQELNIKSQTVENKVNEISNNTNPLQSRGNFSIENFEEVQTVGLLPIILGGLEVARRLILRVPF